MLTWPDKFQNSVDITCCGKRRSLPTSSPSYKFRCLVLSNSSLRQSVIVSQLNFIAANGDGAPVLARPEPAAVRYSLIQQYHTETSTDISQQ